MKIIFPFVLLFDSNFEPFSATSLADIVAAIISASYKLILAKFNK